jgi:hypothetical protein
MSEYFPDPNTLAADGRTIFERVAELRFPLGQYVVVGGTMEAHDIRPARDLDVVVTPGLMDELSRQGWPVRIPKAPPTYNDRHKRKLGTDHIQVYLDLSYDGTVIATGEELIATAPIINGIPFCLPGLLQAWKRIRGREKDIQDVQLIQSYLDAALLLGAAGITGSRPAATVLQA